MSAGEEEDRYGIVRRGAEQNGDGRGKRTARYTAAGQTLRDVS